MRLDLNEFKLTISLSSSLGSLDSTVGWMQCYLREWPVSRDDKVRFAVLVNKPGRGLRKIHW